MQSVLKKWEGFGVLGTQSEFIAVDETGVEVQQLANTLVKNQDEQTVVEKPIDYWIEKYGAWANGYKLNQQFSAQHAQDVLGWEPHALF